MTKCTSTSDTITVDQGASLVMEDIRIFGNSHTGVRCDGKVKAVRCIVEENAHTGVFVFGKQASAEVVSCVIRKNGNSGVWANGGKAVLRGGVMSDKKMYGVSAWPGSKVTVAKASRASRRPSPRTT